MPRNDVNCVVSSRVVVKVGGGGSSSSKNNNNNNNNQYRGWMRMRMIDGKKSVRCVDRNKTFSKFIKIDDRSIQFQKWGWIESFVVMIWYGMVWDFQKKIEVDFLEK